MRILKIGVACFVGLVLFSGCAAPKIDSQKFSPPKTVVIDDFPDINTVATIGIIITRWPAYYFSPTVDGLFTIPGATPNQTDYNPVPGVASSIVTGAITGNQIAAAQHSNQTNGTIAGGIVGGIVGGIIEANAAETQRRAAAFPSLVRDAMPEVDFHADILNALRNSLEEKGIHVTIASESRNHPPRLRWPAYNEKGELLAAFTNIETPPVDADLLVQISPVALYAAPGPLNNYNGRVGIALALYNGRTREFIGWQAFEYEDFKLWYATYNSLVADINHSAPALHDALLALVPAVSRAIAGSQK